MKAWYDVSFVVLADIFVSRDEQSTQIESDVLHFVLQNIQCISVRLASL